MAPDSPRPWTTDRSTVLLDRPPWLRLREDAVRLPTGAVLDPYYVLEYADWACVVPVTGEGRVVMVEQWRHGVGAVSLEFPAGAIDPGEGPESAARRELREEAGVEASALEPLGRVAVEPARHTNWAHLFLAWDVARSASVRPDPGEDLVVREVPLVDLRGLVAQGRIVHGAHVAAAFLALDRLAPR